jgi:hypothetical protein
MEESFFGTTANFSYLAYHLSFNKSSNVKNKLLREMWLKGFLKRQAEILPGIE